MRPSCCSQRGQGASATARIPPLAFRRAHAIEAFRTRCTIDCKGTCACVSEPVICIPDRCAYRSARSLPRPTVHSLALAGVWLRLQLRNSKTVSRVQMDLRWECGASGWEQVDAVKLTQQPAQNLQQLQRRPACMQPAQQHSPQGPGWFCAARYIGGMCGSTSSEAGSLRSVHSLPASLPGTRRNSLLTSDIHDSPAATLDVESRPPSPSALLDAHASPVVASVTCCSAPSKAAVQHTLSTSRARSSPCPSRQASPARSSAACTQQTQQPTCSRPDERCASSKLESLPLPVHESPSLESRQLDTPFDGAPALPLSTACAAAAAEGLSETENALKFSKAHASAGACVDSSTGQDGAPMSGASCAQPSSHQKAPDSTATFAVHSAAMKISRGERVTLQHLQQRRPQSLTARLLPEACAFCGTQAGMHSTCLGCGRGLQLTLLMAAACAGDEVTASELLEAGADVDKEAPGTINNEKITLV